MLNADDHFRNIKKEVILFCERKKCLIHETTEKLKWQLTEINMFDVQQTAKLEK